VAGRGNVAFLVRPSIGFIPDYDPAVRIGPDILRDVDRKPVTVSLGEGQKKTVKPVVPAER
jgi:hypothetical protein